MAKGFDISILGDKELQRKLNKMATKDARKIVSRASRDSAKRLREKVAENTPVDTGMLKESMKSAKVRAQKAKTRSDIRLGIEMPTRQELGIAADEKAYYPFAVEYGHKNAPAHSYIRATVNNEQARELAKIAYDIGKGIGRGMR